MQVTNCNPIPQHWVYTRCGIGDWSMRLQTKQEKASDTSGYGDSSTVSSIKDMAHCYLYTNIGYMHTQTKWQWLFSRFAPLINRRCHLPPLVEDPWNQRTKGHWCPSPWGREQSQRDWSVGSPGRPWVTSRPCTPAPCRDGSTSPDLSYQHDRLSA